MCFVIVYTGGWFSAVLFASIWLGKLLFWECASNYGLEFSDFRLVVLFGYSSVVSVGLRVLWFCLFRDGFAFGVLVFDLFSTDCFVVCCDVLCVWGGLML